MRKLCPAVGVVAIASSLLACGSVDTSADAAPGAGDAAGADGSPGSPDGPPAPLCGQLRFEDVLGTIDSSNPQVSAPSPYAIGDVTFTPGGGGNVFNAAAQQPFATDHWGLYTLGTGATIDFTAEIDHVGFRYAQRNVAGYASFQLRANGVALTTFTAAGSIQAVDVMITPPAAQVQIVWMGDGSGDFLWIDDLVYESPGCP
jgi:hypothetical protein